MPTLTFPATEQGADHFAIAWNAMRLSDLARGTKRSKATMIQEARIRAALRAVSAISSVKDDPDARQLRTTGGTVDLTDTDLALLVRYGWATQWAPQFVEAAVVALLSFEEALPRQPEPPDLIEPDTP